MRLKSLFLLVLVTLATLTATAQQRRPIDSQHPLWFVHIDVWVNADPQKMIDLIPQDIRPFVCMNLSLSCQYDKDLNIYKMPQSAIRSYKSWASVCQKNGMWFTCQPASGGHTHVQDEDLATFEYFFKTYPNFLGWNYAEQFWGFDEQGDKSSSPQKTRLALFAKLVEMSHKYGGFLTVSFCGNQWSYGLSPVGMLKRCPELLAASKKYPEAMLWLLKYTSSGCSYNTESACFGPFVEGLARNYGTRYDWCGFTGALDHIYGEKSGIKFATAAGICTIMEQTTINGGAVWDGPELTWGNSDDGDFNENAVTNTSDGYSHRSWRFNPPFKNAWIDLFRKYIDGTIYIATRDEVVARQKFGILLNATGNDEQTYASWPTLYNGLYKQDNDPLNPGDGNLSNNMCYFKSTGRYRTIPLLVEGAPSGVTVVGKSNHTATWPTEAAKVAAFNAAYPEEYTGTMFVARFKNQLITYTPYNNVNPRKRSEAVVPLQYNTCESLKLDYDELSSGAVRETSNRITAYLNNFRMDTTTVRRDVFTVMGCKSEPTFTTTARHYAAGETDNISVTTSKTYQNGEFTLTVNHFGPVDVVINCEGNATGRKTDTLPETALPAPQQPAAWNGEVFTEAEDMDFKNLTNLNWTHKQAVMTSPYNADNGKYRNERGHAGNGFVIFNNGASLRHTFTVPTAGVYTIDVRYMAKDADGSLSAKAGNTSKTLALTKTGFNSWQHVRFEATLTAGANTIQLDNTGAEVWIDQCSYAPQGTPQQTYTVSAIAADHGTAVFSPSGDVVPGTRVTVTAVPDEGYTLTGWNIIRADDSVTAALTEGDTFTMPEDNVTLQPIFKSTAEASLVYHLDFSNVGVGGIPSGWEVASDSELRHSDQTYGSGSRTFAGFSGFQGKATYWRNGDATYGYSYAQGDQTLDLAPGDYTLTYAIAAWKATPQYYATILDGNMNPIARGDTYTAAPNAGGSTNADISSAEVHTLDFTVPSTGTYAVRFCRQGSGYDEYLLVQCDIARVSGTGIAAPTERVLSAHDVIYDAQGYRLPTLRRGLNIVRRTDGTTRKIILR